MVTRGVTDALDRLFAGRGQNTQTHSGGTGSNDVGRGTTTRTDQYLALLQLPREILDDILGRLDICDEFHLSQTCGALRRMFKRDWKSAFALLPITSRVQFLTGVSWTCPDLWVCAACCEVHSETPGLASSLSSMLWRPPCEQDVVILAGYELRHRYIQQALKWTNMGAAYQSKLDDLMRTYKPKPSRNVATSEFIVGQPKIVNGRFLLFMRWEFTDSVASLMPGSQMIYRGICPHMHLGPPSFPRGYAAPDRSASLDNADYTELMRAAFSTEGREVRGSCRRCPTDYAVLVTPSLLTYSCWSDCGPYTSPLDVRWTVMVKSEQNNRERGPTVYHAPGSVRRLYENGT